jgi:hypothetical protein
MTYPNELTYSFQKNGVYEGSITFTICSQDQEFVKFLLDNIYLDLEKTDFDMEGIIIEDNLFRQTRKILIKKNLSKENKIEE